jgi:hypothetical protein
MRVVGNYEKNGYALLQGLVGPETAAAFVAMLKKDIGPNSLPVSSVRNFPDQLARPAFEIYGHFYPPMLTFLWGLTPIVSEVVGRDLLPTYDYLRIYQDGDVCRVHHDRLSCEHSLSLTLDYSDGVPWNLEVGQLETEPSAKIEEDFGDEPFSSLEMSVGDAVLYQGVHHRHGRLTPNPNGWSVHLFLHWVDRAGPYRDHAFDGQAAPTKTRFDFA